MSNEPNASNLWQISIVKPLVDLQQIEPVFEDFCLTSSLIEHVPDGSLWRLELLFNGEPEDFVLSLIPKDFEFQLIKLENKDWVSESQKQLPPVSAGRFYIHGSHDPCHASPSVYDLTIDAGRAFGTGLHETTYGCLRAIDDVSKYKHPKNVLDLGCGSGVLALAAAKCWHQRILASDIDLDAVIVTNENAKRNRLSPYIRSVHATGLNDRLLKRAAPYDLLIANILAWPLVKLAPDIAESMSNDGIVILSGLLSKQEIMVRNAYRQQGLHLKKRYTYGVWQTLVLSFQ
ncbi:50S ribosomal protein L11 methyltransferase [Sneathiella limimaris]|uniref:50S ribosomal protein L11 methyltransferase n=1 Tax=Sneathiella limimaris TaxID=1964213 RepID=UPI00146BD131|nr:50S ribosomal protein L11 methyltransferase [Sneathiella limimaris]